MFFSALKTILPRPHGYMDEDGRYHIGATWTDGDGLTDTHNVELRYVRNSEKLALQGKPMPDGSWEYVEPNGQVHCISAERAKAFMEKTHEHASIMLQMLERLKQEGIENPIVDASATAA